MKKNILKPVLFVLMTLAMMSCQENEIEPLTEANPVPVDIKTLNRSTGSIDTCSEYNTYVENYIHSGAIPGVINWSPSSPFKWEAFTFWFYIRKDGTINASSSLYQFHNHVAALKKRHGVSVIRLKADVSANCGSGYGWKQGTVRYYTEHS